MAHCPNCKRENPAGTLKCACGYSYLTGETVPGGYPAAANEAPASSGGPPPVPSAEVCPPVPAEAPAATTDYRFAFRGTAREYFGIWIVNMLLKIVTLGFYTAWAKVRQRRYFAGTTQLNGEPFEYLAEPKALFRGWLIAVAAVVIYSVAGRYSPTLALIVGLAIFGVLPWVIVRSRVFNCRNLAHRNIRFVFQPNYAESYRVYLGYPLLVPLTLGILYPYVAYRQKRFLVENGSYGSTPFKFTATKGDFYVFFLLAFLALVGILVMGGLMVGAFGAGLRPVLKGQRYLAFVFPALLGGLYFSVVIGVMTALNNLVWNKTVLGDNRFVSDMNPMTVVWLYFSGFVAVACSLGLLFPWAAIRLRRYRYDHFTLRTAAGIDGFVAGVQAATVGAAGEEIGDVFGLDVDIAL